MTQTDKPEIEALLSSYLDGELSERQCNEVKRLLQHDSQAGDTRKPADEFQPGEFEHYIDEKKPFLYPELHINDLAGQLNMQPYRLSRILNSYYRTNFYDFIGSLRIEEFKKRIKSGEHLKYPILQVAYDCGFNSKSSFYRAFKNITGIKPSEYIKAHDIDE